MSPRIFVAVMLSASWAVAENERLQIPSALNNYVARPQPDFQWKLLKTSDTKAGKVYELSLTSQKWHDIVWQHAVEIYEPTKVEHSKHALLFVDGGSKPGPPDEGDMKTGLKLAQLCGARVVMLHQVPNQPLFGGRKEDDLISDTWLKYLETGDETWPLLFPMVRSAVSAMDAVQEFSKSKWSIPIEHFVITGASKRGWTSWLTPVADKRIVGTAPIVIDVLNFRAQMTHQLESWGEFSEQIIDYTSKGLVKKPGEEESPREINLRRMVDPFTYRKQLALPKLLIVGTNDRYWVVDSMNLYWDDLIGQKFIRQVPNAGHGLEGGREGALVTLGVFFRYVAAGAHLPKVAWNYSNGGQQMKLSIKSEPAPKTVRLWQAHSKDLDFRDDRWESSTITCTDGCVDCSIHCSADAHAAMYGELEFDFGGHAWSLTTLVYRE